jgi:hypothetical protein
MLRERTAYGESEASNEYKIKAVYIFQFINFIEGWEFQKEGNKNNNEPIVIGIIGKSPFDDAFEPLMEKTIQDRKIFIKYFIGFSELNNTDKKDMPHPDLEQIKGCNVLFVCSSEKNYITDILSSIRNDTILTVADMPNFLEKGGIINFILEKNKVLFNINTAAAKRAKLTIRAKLLRLAKKVIETDQIEEQ